MFQNPPTHVVRAEYGTDLRCSVLPTNRFSPSTHIPDSHLQKRKAASSLRQQVPGVQVARRFARCCVGGGGTCSNGAPVRSGVMFGPVNPRRRYSTTQHGVDAADNRNSGGMAVCPVIEDLASIVSEMKEAGEPMFRFEYRAGARKTQSSIMSSTEQPPENPARAVVNAQAQCGAIAHRLVTTT